MINLDVRLQISPFLHPGLGPAGRDGELNKSTSEYQRTINQPSQSLPVKSLVNTSGVLFINEFEVGPCLSAEGKHRVLNNKIFSALISCN